MAISREIVNFGDGPGLPVQCASCNPLIEFKASSFFSNTALEKCNTATTVTLKHNGSNALPNTGDKVFIADGVTPLAYSSGHLGMGTGVAAVKAFTMVTNTSTGEVNAIFTCPTNDLGVRRSLAGTAGIACSANLIVGLDLWFGTGPGLPTLYDPVWTNQARTTPLVNNGGYYVIGSINPNQANEPASIIGINSFSKIVNLVPCS